MRPEGTWQPWMLADFGIQPWQVREYTHSQLRAMQRLSQQRHQQSDE